MESLLAESFVQNKPGTSSRDQHRKRLSESDAANLSVPPTSPPPYSASIPDGRTDTEQVQQHFRQLSLNSREQQRVPGGELSPTWHAQLSPTALPDNWEPPVNSFISNTKNGRPIDPFENLDFAPSTLEIPTVAECITHLKLLHAFSQLRINVGNQQNLFGIKVDVPPDATQHDKDGTGVEERLREKRWAIFVSRAVDRFKRWFVTLPSTNRGHETSIKMGDFEKSDPYGGTAVNPEKFPNGGTPLAIVNHLPPLGMLCSHCSIPFNLPCCQEMVR
jgi:hypothetical protein